MVIRYAVAILVIALAGLYSGVLRAGRTCTAEIPALEQLPRELSGWRGEDFTTSAGVAEVLAADATLHRRFSRADGTEVWVFIAYFAEQQVNSQIHSPRHCIPGGGWAVASIEQAELDLDGDRHPATHMRIAKDGSAHDIYYWFCTQGGTVTGEYSLKWDLVKNSLARRPTNAAFIRYNAQSADSSALRQVMTLLDAPIERILGEVGLQCQ